MTKEIKSILLEFEAFRSVVHYKSMKKTIDKFFEEMCKRNISQDVLDECRSIIEDDYLCC